MDKNLIARVSINIDAPSEKVWDALVTPEAIKQYMFGAENQDNNPTEEARAHSEKNWRIMLSSLKKFLEQ